MKVGTQEETHTTLSNLIYLSGKLVQDQMRHKRHRWKIKIFTL